MATIGEATLGLMVEALVEKAFEDAPDSCVKNVCALARFSSKCCQASSRVTSKGPSSPLMKQSLINVTARLLTELTEFVHWGPDRNVIFL